MAKKPYSPSVMLHECLEHRRAEFQAESDARMAKHELFVDVVDTVLPSGGRGFKAQYYWRDTPIPCGPQSTCEEMIASGKALSAVATD